MEQAFRITYAWSKRETPYEFDRTYGLVRATELFVCFRHFLALYEGQFTVEVGDIGIDFSFDPDLSTVFEELPGVLHQLTIITQVPVELYFFEQGTALMLLLERSTDTILMRFQTGITADPVFAGLPGKSFTVPAAMFLSEWTHFLTAVLDALLHLHASLADDADYQRYRRCLAEVETRYA